MSFIVGGGRTARGTDRTIAARSHREIRSGAALQATISAVAATRSDSCAYDPPDALEMRLTSFCQSPEVELPTAETIGAKLNALGYFPKKVAKTQPQKKSLKPTTSLTT